MIGIDDETHQRGDCVFVVRADQSLDRLGFPIRQGPQRVLQGFVFNVLLSHSLS